MVSFKPYSLPLQTEYRWAKGVQHRRGGLIVRAEVAGAVGWGECAPTPEKPVDPDAMIGEAQALVHGLDCTSDGFLAALDRRAPEPRLRCGVATAWLAARAAARGLPLGGLIARDAEQPAPWVPVNGLVTEAEPADAAERARALRAEGLRTLKIKCNGDRDANVARVAAIRAAVPDAALRLDANESWPREWSLAHLADLARHRIEYVEQPLPRGEPLEAFVALRRTSPVRIAIDESGQDVETVRRFLAAGACDVVILKSQRIGGPDRLLEVVRIARSFGVPCTVTVSLETAVGLHTALHCASLLPAPIPDCGLAMTRFFARDVADAPVIRNGRMDVPRAPGLGVDPSAFWGAPTAGATT